MCGIGGIKRMGSDPIPREPLDILLQGLQNRGNDATGVAVANPPGCAKPGVFIYKKDDTPWHVTVSKPYKEFMAEHLLPETESVILHTRAATGTASPRKYANNHPMYDGKVAVVHNGVIQNDTHLFTEMGLTRSCDTDSDILRAILDKEGFTKGGIRKLSKITGGVACAALTPDDTEKLLLVRSGNPLVLAKFRDYLVFASEKTYIHTALREWEEKWGMYFHKSQVSEVGWLTMNDHSAWLIGKEGLEWYDECKTCFSYSEPCRRVFQDYAKRTAKWDEEGKSRKVVGPPYEHTYTPMRIKCRGCGSMNKLKDEHQKLAANKLTCGTCKKLLAD